MNPIIENIYQQAKTNYKKIILAEGEDERIAEITADKGARLIADTTFHQDVVEQLGLQDECCFNTLMNPIITPLGSGIDLDPAVDIGQRMSQLTLRRGAKPVLPGAKGEVVPQPRKARVYLAR